MATVTNYVIINDAPVATTYNTNSSNASTFNTLGLWNAILLDSYRLIESVTDGIPRTSFVSPDGRSISLGFSTGTLELLNGKKWLGEFEQVG